MPLQFHDPSFLLATLLAVVLVGLSKGGLGGAMGFVGVPLMSLVMSPVQAAAILLPILVLMDIVSLWTWRGNYHRPTLAAMLPGSLVGIGIGWATAALVTAGAIRLIVGLVAILFVARWLYTRYWHGTTHAASPKPIAAAFWGTVSGFTSFIAHVGGPPFQMYALPLRLDQKTFTGTAVIFFAITNAVKLVPYFALGQFDATNLATSAMLMPIAPLAPLAGAWVVRRMRPETFYTFSYATVGLIAVKLVYDGVLDILAW
jgi:uncharacterized membrane protein YfcA